MEGKMGKVTVTVMMTCFNRKEYTTACVRALAEGNPSIVFRFIITDDNSSDGTKEALGRLPYTIILLEGDGQLYWNGGMQKSLDYALKSEEKTDYYMLVNDDVKFAKNAVERLIERQKTAEKEAVIVGATTDRQGRISYGGVKLLSKHFAKFALVEPSVPLLKCDTFNGNCVLLPKHIFEQAGNVDGVYRHSMSDYDYGMHIRRLGFPIYNGEGYVGVCEDNEITGSWRDVSLSRKERLKKKESPKGLPRKDWYYFIKKNYGFFPALYHSITPYLRILLKK